MRKSMCACAAGLVLLAACKSSSAPQLIGGVKDGHGCLKAAGYTWSELRRDCIRIFEEGVRAEDPSARPELASYAVFSADSGKVEMFRPSPYSNEILDRRGSVWKGKTCELSRDGQKWVLREVPDLKE